jgi:hypothetical protein
MGPKATKVKCEKLTPAEVKIVESLLKKFGHKHELQEGGSIEIHFDAPLAKVHKFLLKEMKGDRPTITAIRLHDGRIEEVKTIDEAEAKGAEAAVSTTKPRRGCPLPIYSETLKKDMRATDVLTEFLNLTQMKDFLDKGCLVVRGVDSGHRLLISHRYSRAASDFGLLYDLDRDERMCIERSDLPPSEELLSLLVVLSCRGRETEWRTENNAPAN